MRTLLNIIWLILSGIWLAIGYAIAALVMAILVITLPFAAQSLKLAGYSLWPFGRAVVKKESAGAATAVGNVLWLVCCGWWLAIMHIVAAFFLAITVVGLPLAYANIKLAPLALLPFGREIVPAGQVVRLAPGHVVVSADPMLAPAIEGSSGTPELPSA